MSLESLFSHTVTLCFATTKLMTGIIYWPWFLSVLAGCILDVVATVYHVLDITHTTVRRFRSSLNPQSKPSPSPLFADLERSL